MKKARDVLFFTLAVLFFWLYLPHFIIFFLSNNKILIKNDLEQLSQKINIKLNFLSSLLFFLHNSPYFRTVFYHRVGPIQSLLIGWWRPGCEYFTISKTTSIAGGVLFAHPYSTIINAKSIGKNFSFRHLTTLGNKGDNENRPTIGDNVTLGACVTIIGKINVGNNVVIGAGSIVTKDIPDNCVFAGNPARFIKAV
jgi:serine O-acetyltransferase